MKKTNKKLIEKVKKIKIVLTDVDGVLTDGGVYFSSKGESLKKFNMRDGMGVELLHKNNIKTVLITKENSKIVKKRGKKIKADGIFMGITDKKKYLSKIKKKFLLETKNIAYIGDDVNDLEIMKSVGFSATPSDGHITIKQISDYICKNNGGNGAFREFVDLILEYQKK